MALGAHLALQNHHILPSDYTAMPVAERAFLYASDLVSAEAVKARIKEG